MKNVIFIVPVAQRSTLSCVWIETGNPAQRLVCTWIDHTQRMIADREESEAEPYRLSA